MTSTETFLSTGILELAARQLNAAVSDVAVTRLTGDASTRVYFRARAGDASLIISIYADPFDEAQRAADRLARQELANPSARLTYANDPCAHIEVSRLFRDAGLPVPQVFAASGKEHAILFEDVGDLRLQDWLAVHTEQDAARAYGGAVELIVKIQEATGKAISSDSICSHMAFDEAKLRWELGFFFANYFNRYLGLKLTPETASAVQQNFKNICVELASRPRVLVHRDYHARNLMMFDGRMYIIDHQDARMGPASYDLASLIHDPYTDIPPSLVTGLIEQFIELKLRSSLPLGDAREFKQELELMNIQRMLKAVGTYSFQTVAKNNLSYVNYIEPAVDRALNSINLLGRFQPLRDLLERARTAQPVT